MGKTFKRNNQYNSQPYSRGPAATNHTTSIIMGPKKQNSQLRWAVSTLLEFHCVTVT